MGRKPDRKWHEPGVLNSERVFFAAWFDKDKLSVMKNTVRFRTGGGRGSYKISYCLKKYNNYYRFYYKSRNNLYEMGTPHSVRLAYGDVSELGGLVEEHFGFESQEELQEAMWPSAPARLMSQMQPGSISMAKGSTPEKMPTSTRRADPMHMVVEQWGTKAADTGIHEYAFGSKVGLLDFEQYMTMFTNKRRSMHADEIIEAVSLYKQPV